MDWTFLVLSAGVVALAAVVFPLTTRDIRSEVIIRTTLFGAAFVSLLYLEGPTWPLYKLLIGFFFGMSVWIIFNRSDSTGGGPDRGL